MSGLGLISTVIPSYNYGKYVCDAVDSVLRQTYRGGLEVIVVDDGSTDDTRERLAGYGDKIRYVHQANRGLPGARNTGIRAAKGEWIGLLDADDMIHPQLYEVLAHVVERDKLDLLTGGKVEDAALLTGTLPTSPPIRRVVLRDLFSTSPLSASGTIVRKQAIVASGYFDESLRSCEDRDMWLRMVIDHALAAAPAAKGFYYRSHPGQMNRNPERMLANFEKILDKFFTEHHGYDEYRALAHAFMHLDTAICYVENGRRKEAAQHLLRSLRLYPWVPKQVGKLSTATRLKILARVAVGDPLFFRLTGSQPEG